MTEKTATVLHIPSQSSFKVQTHTLIIIPYTLTHSVTFTYSQSDTYVQSNAQCLVPIQGQSKHSLTIKRENKKPLKQKKYKHLVH